MTIATITETGADLSAPSVTDGTSVTTPTEIIRVADLSATVAADVPSAAPDFDRTDGDEIADEMLMESAGNATVGKVQGRMGWRQSAESRAWTKSGNVD